MRRFLYLLSVLIGSLLTAALVYIAYLRMDWGSPIQTLSAILMFLASVVVLIDLVRAASLRWANSQNQGSFALVSTVVLIILLLSAAVTFGAITPSMHEPVFLTSSAILGAYALLGINARTRVG